MVKRERALIVGIDPGLDGAIAVLDDQGELVVVQDVPTTAVVRAKGKKRVYLPSQMLAIMEATARSGQVKLVGLENVHAMPGQGVTSMFSMGRGMGLWEMAIAAARWPMEYVEPGKWKREMLGAGSGKDKQASIVRAQQLVPNSIEFLKLKKHDGRAEAILIAAYLLRRLGDTGGRR